MASNKVNIRLPSLESLQPEIRLEGDWKKLDKLSEHLQRTILDGYQRGVIDIGKRLTRIVRQALRTGIPPPGSGVTWDPLSESTIHRYGDHPIYNLTGTYSRCIGLSIYRSRILVGIPLRTRRSSRGGLTMNQLAILLEYGSREEGGNIPPRPVWGPALKSIGGKQSIKATIIRNIRSELLKRTGVRPNQVR